MINLLIVDDHELVRHGIRLILSKYDDINIIGEAESGEEAIKFIAHTKPDIVLMDVQMPGMGGLEAIRRILKYHHADTKIIVLTALENDHLIDLCVSGYLTKHCHADEMIDCIRTVHAGKRYVNEEISEEIKQQRIEKSYIKYNDRAL